MQLEKYTRQIIEEPVRKEEPRPNYGQAPRGAPPSTENNYKAQTLLAQGRTLATIMKPIGKMLGKINSDRQSLKRENLEKQIKNEIKIRQANLDPLEGYGEDKEAGIVAAHNKMMEEVYNEYTSDSGLSKAQLAKLRNSITSYQEAKFTSYMTDATKAISGEKEAVLTEAVNESIKIGDEMGAIDKTTEMIADSNVFDASVFGAEGNNLEYLNGMLEAYRESGSQYYLDRVQEQVKWMHLDGDYDKSSSILSTISDQVRMSQAKETIAKSSDPIEWSLKLSQGAEVEGVIGELAEDPVQKKKLIEYAQEQDRQRQILEERQFKENNGRVNNELAMVVADSDTQLTGEMIEERLQWLNSGEQRAWLALLERQGNTDGSEDAKNNAMLDAIDARNEILEYIASGKSYEFVDQLIESYHENFSRTKFVDVVEKFNSKGLRDNLRERQDAVTSAKSRNLIDRLLKNEKITDTEHSKMTTAINELTSKMKEDGATTSEIQFAQRELLRKELNNTQEYGGWGLGWFKTDVDDYLGQSTIIKDISYFKKGIEDRIGTGELFENKPKRFEHAVRFINSGGMIANEDKAESEIAKYQSMVREEFKERFGINGRVSITNMAGGVVSFNLRGVGRKTAEQIAEKAFPDREPTREDMEALVNGSGWMMDVEDEKETFIPEQVFSQRYPAYSTLRKEGPEYVVSANPTDVVHKDTGAAVILETDDENRPVEGWVSVGGYRYSWNDLVERDAIKTITAENIGSGENEIGEVYYKGRLLDPSQHISKVVVEAGGNYFLIRQVNAE